MEREKLCVLNDGRLPLLQRSLVEYSDFSVRKLVTMEGDTKSDLQGDGGQRATNKKALTLRERVAVIHTYEKIPNTRKLAHMFGCGRTQIQNILRYRHEYLEEWQNNGDPYLVRRRQSAQMMNLGIFVYEWVQRCRNAGMLVSDEMIRRTGVQIANKLVVPDFRPNNRWLSRFKQKYKLGNTELLVADPTVLVGDLEQKSIDIDEMMEEMRQNQLAGNLTDNWTTIPDESHTQPGDLQSNGIEDDVNNATGINPDLLYIFSDGSSNETCNEGNKYLNEINDQNGSQRLKDRAAVMGITSYREALNHLGPLEQFALLEEDIRAVGLINQLENLFREKMQISDKN